MGAVLACGPRAVLSHRAGATLWGLGHFPYVEVTARTCRARPGILVHTSLLPDDEVTVESGIPVTTVVRTLLDLAGVVRPHVLERAISQAEIRGLGDSLSIADLAARYPGRRGLRA